MDLGRTLSESEELSEVSKEESYDLTIPFKDHSGYCLRIDCSKQEQTQGDWLGNYSIIQMRAEVFD